MSAHKRFFFQSFCFYRVFAFSHAWGEGGDVPPPSPQKSSLFLLLWCRQFILVGFSFLSIFGRRSTAESWRKEEKIEGRKTKFKTFQPKTPSSRVFFAIFCWGFLVGQRRQRKALKSAEKQNLCKLIDNSRLRRNALKTRDLKLSSSTFQQGRGEEFF